jgi:hypothetical protein
MGLPKSGGRKAGDREARVERGEASQETEPFEVSLMLGYLRRREIEELWNQLMRVDKMLTSLIRSLSKSRAND